MLVQPPSVTARRYRADVPAAGRGPAGLDIKDADRSRPFCGFV